MDWQTAALIITNQRNVSNAERNEAINKAFDALYILYHVQDRLNYLKNKENKDQEELIEYESVNRLFGWALDGRKE